MARTTKTARAARDDAEPLADTQPVYFVDPPPVVLEPAVEQEREDDVGRLRGMLDRAGDPVLRPPQASAESRQQRRGSRVCWRNDPHVLGRIAAAVVVLVLLVACAVVGLHVLG